MGILIVALLQGEKPFYGDAGHFWQLGATFYVHGHFSLLNFSDSWRGYTLPLVDHVLRLWAHDLHWTSSFIVKVFNAVIFALIGTVLGPSFARTVWPERPRWGLVRRLALTALLVVFWAGFLAFPLSDFPGLALVLVAFLGIARHDSPGWMLTAGAALAASINMRNAYVPLVPVVLALVAWNWFEQRGKTHASAGRRALCIGLLFVGFAAVSLPQSLSAHRYYKTWSFVPGTSILNPGAFYTISLPVQTYDTYVGHDEPGKTMSYVYPAGMRLLEEQKEGRITGTGQFLGLFVSHPLVMGGMLLRHIVNGMDPLFDTTYIENLNSGWRSERRIGGLLVAFIALLRLLWPAARRMLGAGRLRYLAALSICSLTSLPTEMERRYLLPVYLICYLLVLAPGGWPKPIGSAELGLRRYRTAAVATVAFVAFASMFWYITSDAISNLRFGA